MTVDFLKNLFLEQYADNKSYYDVPTIYVTMKEIDYVELYNDIIKENGEEGNTQLVPDVERLAFTKILVPFVCQFIVKIGEDFSFSLQNDDDQYYEEL